MAPKAEGKSNSKGGKDGKSGGKSSKSQGKGYWEDRPYGGYDEDDGKKSKGKGGKKGESYGDYDDRKGKGGGGKDGRDGKFGGRRGDYDESNDKYDGDGDVKTSLKSLNSSAAAFQPSGMYGSQFWWQPMPPLWQEFTSQDGTPYYYNSRTGLTQWERPAELDPPAPPVIEASRDTEKDRRDGDRRSGARDLDKDDRRGAGRSDDRNRGGDRENRSENRDRGGDDGDRNRGGAARGKRGGKDGGKDGGKGGSKGGGKGGGGADPTDFGPPGCNLFVFHLPDDWTDDDLHEYFAPHGNVMSAKVMKELGTGRSRGFGFVSYEDRVGASTAVKKMQGYKILGKRLKVEFKKGEQDGNDKDDDKGLPDDDDGPRKNYPDDERLIGYLRAISAKNVVQSLKESENEGKKDDDKDDAPLNDDGGDQPDDDGGA